MDFKKAFAVSLSGPFIPNNILFTREADYDFEPCLYIHTGNNAVFKSGMHYSVAPLNCACVIFIYRGAARLTVGGDTLYAAAPSLAFFDCRGGHELFADEGGCEFYAFYLGGCGTKYFLNEFSENTRGAIIVQTAPEFVLRFADLTEHLAMYASDTLLQLRFFTTLFSDVFKDIADDGKNNVPEYLSQIKRLFDTEFTQSYTLDMLEHRFHINKYKIAKDFTRFFGCAPIHYLNRRRIETAETLLLQTDNQINEIGFKVGFETTNHFINLFKKQYGITPAAYRKAFKTPSLNS